jgi:hypothetical protein
MIVDYYPDTTSLRIYYVCFFNERSFLHRTEGPAYIEFFYDGQIRKKFWYNDGRIHREGGPAGIKYHKNGRIHELLWCNRDIYHNEDGPARIIHNVHPLGDHLDTTISEYWLANSMYNKDRYDELIGLSKSIKSDRNMALLHIKHKEEYIRVISKEVLCGV